MARRWSVFSLATEGKRLACPTRFVVSRRKFLFPAIQEMFFDPTFFFHRPVFFFVFFSHFFEHMKNAKNTLSRNLHLSTVNVFSAGMLQFSTGLSATFWLVNLHHKLVRVECALSLSRIPLSEAFTAEMSDAESFVEESKPKDPSANPKPQSSELVDEVLSLFKGYLETKLEAQGKLFEGQSKIQRSASEFKFSNRKQFEVNAKLEKSFLGQN